MKRFILTTKLLLLLAFVLSFSSKTIAQFVYASTYDVPSQLYLIDLRQDPCVVTQIGDMGIQATDIAICPGGDAYATDGQSIYSLDLATGATTLLGNMNLPQGTSFPSLGCRNDGYIFAANRAFYVINPFTWRPTLLGGLPITTLGDVMFYNYDYYYSTFWGAYDLVYPETFESFPLVIGGGGFQGLAAYYDDCHVIVGGTAAGEIKLIDVSLGTITPVNCAIQSGISGMASLDDFETAPNCDSARLNLDEDFSSGTSLYNYKADDVNCGNYFTNVADIDIKINATEVIETATITLESFQLDGTNEHLYLDPAFANNIGIAGNNTEEIILTNQGGASVDDFETAIKNTVYQNLAFTPTPAEKKISIQFITDVGRKSNAPFTVFEVFSSIVEVDIDDYGRICEGDAYDLNGITGGDVSYLWSTDETESSIQATEPGYYYLTVTDNETGCYSVDSFLLDVDPFTYVKFESVDDSICFGDLARVRVISDYMEPFTIYVRDGNNNSLIPYIDVTNNEIIEIFSGESAEFFVDDVQIFTGGPSCFTWDSATVYIEVFPITINTVYDTICSGDSIFLERDWQTEIGTYKDDYLSQYGCDSTVYTELWVKPTYDTLLTYGSCNTQDTGLFEVIYEAQNGCDSTVVTYVYYQPSDTTRISDRSCIPSEVGIDTFFFTNRFDCDSIVFLTVNFVEGDTTFLQQSSCDESEIGIDTTFFIGSRGCDSIVYLETTLLPSDVVFTFRITCEPTEAGMDTFILTNVFGCDSMVIEEVILENGNQTNLVDYSCIPGDIGLDTVTLNNQFGCDSLVITETLLLDSDITNLSEISCDTLDAGIDSVWLLNSDGCDSLVITTTTFVESILTEIFTSSCNPFDTGVVDEILVSAQGCDSVVRTFTSLDPSNLLEVNGTTCIPSEARDETIVLQNQYGCDSIIVYNILYIPLDTTFYFYEVCDELDTGTIVETLTSVEGCDSIIITATTLASEDDCMLLGQAFADTTDCNVNTGEIRIELSEGTFPIQYTWTLLPGGTPETNSLTGPSRTIIISGLDPGTYEIDILDALDASASFTIEIIDIQPPIINAFVSSNYNGADISCKGASDGVAQVEVLSGGQAPYAYQWSSNHQTPTANNLFEGTYSVTVTDRRGCFDIDSVILSEPDSLLLFWEVEDQDCREGFGSIYNISASGGVEPYTFTLDGSPVSGSSVEDLLPGQYPLQVVDANNCTDFEFTEIEEARPPIVDLGPDLTVNFGDTFRIELFTNAADSEIDSVIWSDGQCEGCLVRKFVLTDESYISVTLIRDDGCQNSDEIRLRVVFNDNIYTPNAFSPNHDAINDFWRVYEGGQIRTIEELVIFNRWGDRVFERSGFHPDNSQGHWDGTFNGKALEPGVFTFYMKALMNDGTYRVRQGDILLTL